MNENSLTHPLHVTFFKLVQIIFSPIHQISVESYFSANCIEWLQYDCSGEEGSLEGSLKRDPQFYMREFINISVKTHFWQIICTLYVHIQWNSVYKPPILKLLDMNSWSYFPVSVTRTHIENIPSDPPKRPGSTLIWEVGWGREINWIELS